MPRRKKETTTQTPPPEQGTQPTNTFAHLPTMAAMFGSLVVRAQRARLIVVRGDARTVAQRLLYLLGDPTHVRPKLRAIIDERLSNF